MKDKISDHQILLSLQCLRNWKSFTNWEILPGRGGDISHHTLFCCGAAHGYYSEPLRLPPGMELARTLNSNIPSPPPSLWSYFHTSEIFQTSTQGPQCLSQFRENSLFPMHRLTLSSSVFFKMVWVAISFPEAANRGRIGIQESGVKGILHLFPSTSKNRYQSLHRPKLEYRTPKEKQ